MRLPKLLTKYHFPYHNSLKTVALLLSCIAFFPHDSAGQYSSPTVDGIITAGEYGVHADGQNQNTNNGVITFITWDAANIYVAIANANVGEALIIYIDKDPQIPVNGGLNSNGTDVGFNYDGTNFAALQFRADLVVYAKNGFREYRTADGFNGWSSAVTGWGTYSDNGQFDGTGVQEVAIPWSALSGFPSSFNFFCYKATSAGFVYSQQPTSNSPSGFIGSSARWERYYTVNSTANGTAIKPFSRDCYVFNLTSNNNSFGAISVYDFTMSSLGFQITRLSTGGDWNISGNLVAGNGTINFGSGGSGYGQTTVANIDVRGGSLNMDQTNKAMAVTGNISISSGTLQLSGSFGGDLKLGGNFTKTSGTFNCNGRQIEFNGNIVQTWSGTATESVNYLLNSNTTNTVNVISSITIVNNLTINANARLDIGTTILTLTGATSAVNGYLRSSGTGNISGASASTLTINSGGAYEHNYAAPGGANLGAIPTATWNVGSTCAIIGLTNPNNGSWFAPASSATQAFSNFRWNTPLLTTMPNMGGATITVSQTFSLMSTGSGQLRLGTGTNGTINCTDFSQSGGILNLSNGAGTGIINCTGNFIQTAGTITETAGGSGTINLIKTSGTQSLIVSGTVNNNINWNVGNGATTNTVQLQANMNAGAGTFNVFNNATIDFGSVILTGVNTFALQSGANLVTANTNGIYATTATGSVQSTGARTYDLAANYTYNGSSAQFTGTGFIAARNLTINNSNGVTLSANVSVSKTLSLQTGILALGTGTNSLTITNVLTTAITGYTSSNFIRTNGTGELRRSIDTIGFPLNYIFPVGNTSYTPVSYNFSDNTVATNLYVRAIESTHPNVASTDYIQNRYWVTNLSDPSGFYTYSATYNILPGDITGTQSNIRLSKWNGLLWSSISGSSSTGTTLNSGIVTESTAPLQSPAQWCGRNSPSPTTYTWNSTGAGSWSIPANWSPNGVPSDGDAVMFNNGSTSVIANVPTGITLTKFAVGGNSNITLQAGSPGALNIGGGTVPQFNVAAFSTLIVGGTTTMSLNIVNGNTGTIQGNVQLKEASHKITAEATGGLTFNSGSYFAAGVLNQTTYSGNPFGSAGSSNTVVFQNGSIFEQFEGSNPFALSQPSSKVIFQTGSLYKFSNTNGIAFPSFSGRTYANFEYNVNQSKAVSGTGGFSMQNLTITLGTYNINLTGTCNIAGNVSVANGSNLTFNPPSAATYNLNGTTQNITVNGAGTLSISSAANLNIANGTTVNMIGESTISGTGIFTLNNGSTLGIASINGISSVGSTGNIQTTIRNFNAGANYVYNGSSNQVTGNGLPGNVAGSLNISSIGSVGNNTVTLTTTNTSVSTLNLNSGYFSIGSGQQLNIYSGGMVNGTGGDFVSGTTGGTLNFQGSGTFSGTLNPYNVYVSGGINFGTQSVTINGTFRINNGGWANTNAPYYATGSTLEYYSSNTYGRSLEWSNTSGRGYPYNVTVSNNTTLNYPNGTSVARSIAGNLQIDAGSSLYMDYGSPGLSAPVSVKGNVVVYGNLSLGDANGGDLNIAGNWLRSGTTSNFAHNNRKVIFNNQSAGSQTITVSNGITVEIFYDLVTSLNSGSLDLSVNTDLTILNNLNLLAGNLIINSNTVTLQGTVTGTSTFTGSLNSNLTVNGTGSGVGTLYFTSGSQVLNKLTLDRAGSAPAAVMGTSLTLNALTLNNGILVTDNNLLTVASGSGITLPAIYTSSYICLCNASGTSPISFTQPFDGSLGFRISNVGNSDNYFPVGVDFISPNKMWLKNYGDADDMSVALEKGDIGLTAQPRVNRIWYIKQSNPGSKKVMADMRLYFTKRDWTNFLVTEDEIETGFVWSDVRLVQKDYYDPNYLNVAQDADIKSWLGAFYDDKEVYAEYTFGVSPDVNNMKNGIDTFTRFSVINLMQFILPVTIINVSAAQSGKNVKVKWTSITESNISHYEIQRSNNSTGFVAIGIEQALNNGKQITDYSFIDINSIHGNSYYRIVAVDKDGKTINSSIVRINIVFTGQQLIVYPNPLLRNATFNVSLSWLKAGEYNFSLRDVNGKEVMKHFDIHNGGYFSKQYNLRGHLSTGIYFINLITGSGSYHQKIVIY